jgi:WD40 repeat protein
MMILRGHADAVRSLAYSPDGLELATAGDDKTIALWNVAQGKVEETLKHKAGVEAVAYSPDGTLLAAATAAGEIVLWDRGARTRRRSVQAHAQGSRALAFLTEGNYLVTGGWDGSIQLIDCRGKGWMRWLGARTKDVIVADRAPVLAVASGPRAPHVAAGSHDGSIALWDLNQRSAPAATLEQSGPAVFALAWAPENQTIASGDADGVIKLWDLTGLRQRAVLKGHEWSIYSLAFSLDGRTLLSGSADCTVRLWDVTTAGELSVFHWHQSWVTCVAFAPDGMTAAAGSADHSVVIWDLE